ARDIQRQMLPEKAPTVKNLDVAGSVTPASLVGGDIYDYLNAKNGDLLMFISDVTGHGVPAGMIASITNSCLWSYATTVERLDEILVAMNRVVYAKTGPSMFATALLSRWDAKTRQIRYCNAGHEQIMHYQAKTQTIRLIGKGGMALGMIADLKKLLKEESLTLEKGDVMLLYTDGIPEAWKDEKNNLGLSGFSELARKVISRGQTAETIRKNILEGVNRFRKNFPQKDDITLIVAKAL
ncbi:MAG: PP2C family protein-serine/threonine phosphatase, partial [bacterium]|nr:PP2C family protein-serine/threonine phosphatase [bacterium]